MMKIRTRHPAGPAKSWMEKFVLWLYHNPLAIDVLVVLFLAAVLVILRVLL